MRIPTKLSTSILAFRGLQSTFIDTACASLMVLFGNEKLETIRKKIEDKADLTPEERERVSALERLAMALRHAMDCSVTLGIHLGFEAKVLSREAFVNPDNYDAYVADETESALQLAKAILKSYKEADRENANNGLHGKKV